jgi:hypothetical protein
MIEPYCLSKSKYLQGLKCYKLLWMSYHAKDKIPPTDAATQAIFDQGHEVTVLAKTLFKDGLDVEGDDLDVALKNTQTMLLQKKPLFEAALRFKNTVARPDILSPNKDGSWDLYEVKSSTEVKDIYLEDVAFQKYCYEGAGLKIGRVFIVHINNKYVKKGSTEPKGLLLMIDVSAQANLLAASVEGRVNEMVAMLNQKECPKVSIGPHCSEPYDCSLQDFCWQHIPKDSVFILNRIRKDKAFAFINEGIIRAKDIPLERLSSANHKLVHQCHAQNKAHINPVVVQSFVKTLEYPIHFMDFETVGMELAIPRYDGTRPYQQIPFQFSLHVLAEPAKKLEHYAFLAEGLDDPRPEFLKKLKTSIGSKGSIVVYNLTFEKSRLQECAEAYPEYQKWFNEISSRFVDLMGPFQKFDYYDPKQFGRYSIKSVYPALVGGSYDEMEISGGGEASREYARVTFSAGITEEDRKKVYRGLLEYCKLDTEAMASILDILRKV